MRDSGWIQTFTGKQFWPLDSREEDICIEDIAHALSNICRYGGHTKEFYSVAQHSVLVSLQCQPEDAFAGLMHDASEAYLYDLPRPVKHALGMELYREAEKRLDSLIAHKYGIAQESAQRAKAFDDVLLMTERRDLMVAPPIPWSPCHAAPLETSIVAWSPLMSKFLFLEYFHHLRKGLPNG
jgi:uncharacterized protein